VAHDNAVLRHFVTKIVFPGDFDRQKKKIMERKTPFSHREHWSNLIGI